MLQEPYPVQLPPLQLESNVSALLGPTNTGKTHRAIERMLQHRSGVIGFPLRLLAREVYERVCAKVGPQKVALLTGEERCIPKHARYWLCTVESMPQEQDFDFVAIDEIQLACDRERGHVFTQRLISARGTRETCFLGSPSMERMIRAVIPHVQVERLTRLSTLRYGGSTSLSGLPPRSAVVALSRRELYPIAEHIRQRKGGVALVLGALSPNARNAQVELFQSGKVDYMVATDAIGMGLNLDLQHVVFASLHKFDGRQRRALALDEMAQIAGRAGRHTQDGHFYTLHTGPQLEDSVVRAIEEHRFRDKTRLVWRNDALDFASPERLIASLRCEAPRGIFQRLQQADDFEALCWLCKRSAVLEHLRSAADLRRLWTVCQIPDYRKLMLDRHFLLLEEIFIQLSQHQGQLDPSWLERKLKAVHRKDGGIELLMTRLAFVRTWSYVSHRPGWLASPHQWQARIRAIEEEMSDALHEALTKRFLERGATPGQRGVKGRNEAKAGPRRHGRATSKASPNEVEQGHPFAALASWTQARPSPEPEAMANHWIEQWLAGEDCKLRWGEGCMICWGEQVVGELRRGSGLLRPEVLLRDIVDEQVNSRERALLRRRLFAFVQGRIQETLLAPACAPDCRSSANAAGRALGYALELNAGVSPWAELPSVWRRGANHALGGIHQGWLYVYTESCFTGRGQELRSRLIEASGIDAQALPDWVRGLCKLGAQELSIPALEASLSKSLGSPRTPQAGDCVRDSGPCLGIEASLWYALLERLGWRVDSDSLRYHPRRDRARYQRSRPAGRKRRAKAIK